MNLASFFFQNAHLIFLPFEQLVSKYLTHACFDWPKYSYRDSDDDDDDDDTFSQKAAACFISRSLLTSNPLCLHLHGASEMIVVVVVGSQIWGREYAEIITLLRTRTKKERG